MEALSWWLWQECRDIDAVQAGIASLELQAFARETVVAASHYDAILTPVLAHAPLRHGELDPSGPDPAATFARSGSFTPFTAICNVTGQPAISLPLYAREDGLPLAVQLIGRPAGEGPLLALAAQIEQALPWSGRRAPRPSHAG
jgi:amidase